MQNRNVPFLAWMLLFPLCSAGSDYLEFLASGSVAKHYSDGVNAFGALFIIAAWIVVGALLFERED